MQIMPMKTKENITLYCCDFCKKELKVKHAMEKHETNCYHNPANNKACYGCAFLEREKIEVPFESYGYDDEPIMREVDAFKCAKLEKLMYPFSIERRGIAQKYSTFDEQEPMPKACAERKDEPEFFTF